MVYAALSNPHQGLADSWQINVSAGNIFGNFKPRSPLACGYLLVKIVGSDERIVG